MKNLLYFLLSIISLCFFLISCNDDDLKDPATNNHLEVGDTVYEPSFGSLENYGPGGDYEGYD